MSEASCGTVGLSVGEMQASVHSLNRQLEPNLKGTGCTHEPQVPTMVPTMAHCFMPGLFQDVCALASMDEWPGACVCVCGPYTAHRDVVWFRQQLPEQRSRSMPHIKAFHCAMYPVCQVQLHQQHSE